MYLNIKYMKTLHKLSVIFLKYAPFVAGTLNLDVFGEEYEYLVGDIGQEMFPVAKQFLCEHCRKDL